MATRPLGAQISHMLKSRGVDVIFGIPGVHNQEMYRGIEEAGITHVLARHEQGAGFMADGYARASGKPGIAYVITGPGLCNVMTPLGQAYSDSVPVLVISSCLDETAARRGQLHQMRDQQAAGTCVCDWSLEGRSAQSVYDLVDRAFYEFMSQRPRPKHIQVPIALGQSGAEAAPPPRRLPDTAPFLRAEAPPERVAEVAEALRGARKPLIIFGGGTVRAGAGAAAREVVRRSGAATFSTYAGSGVTEPGHERDFGTYLARPDSAGSIAAADVVMVVGSELAEVDLWRDDPGIRGRLIRVDIDPAELEDPRADIAVLSDAKCFLEDLAAVLPDRADTGWSAKEISGCRARWKAEADAERPGIVPVCDALRAGLPAGTMIFSDMTQFAYVAKEVWPMERPGHWHHPYGFGTLGYALPAAIGGSVARPGMPTLCIAGDYGFQYTIQELGTAVELGLPLPILLWDNGKLKEIEDSMVRAQIAPKAVVAHNPDFAALALAYGALAETPGSVDEMVRAVGAAFSADRPTLIRITPELAGGQ